MLAGTKKTKQEALRETIDAFKSLQDEMARKTSELEQLEKTPVAPQNWSHREALKRTIEVFDLAQAELSRKTEDLEKAGKGKGVARDQLCRYLNGQKDLYAEAYETLVRALPQKGRMMYFGLLLSSYSQEE